MCAGVGAEKSGWLDTRLRMSLEVTIQKSYIHTKETQGPPPLSLYNADFLVIFRYYLVASAQ